jgi:23S rRNA pseudouridine2605 synthase
MPRSKSFGRDKGKKKSSRSDSFNKNSRSTSSGKFSKSSFSHSEKRQGDESAGRSYKKSSSFKGRDDRSYKKFPKSGAEKQERSSTPGGKASFDNYERKPFVKRRPAGEAAKNETRGFFNKQKFKSAGKKFQSKEEPQVTQPAKIRLNKYISNSGVCSRREADNLITMGLISVNGKIITEMGYKVNPGDEVRYESRVLRAEKPVYILMNKPKGFLTTTSDPQERNTVMHIIGSAVKERVYPVGRLDRNTTGLLLLTNDGDLAEKLSHPSYNVKKIYKVELDRTLTKNDFQKIVDGVPLEEGRAMIDDLAIVSPDGKTIGLELHIGWNRVVRRIFETLGYQVVKLDRAVYAGLDKKDLPRGEWRFLKPEEIIRLKHYK